MNWLVHNLLFLSSLDTNGETIYVVVVVNYLFSLKSTGSKARCSLLSAELGDNFSVLWICCSFSGLTRGCVDFPQVVHGEVDHPVTSVS